ncbi:MAG: NADH dehydrogenase [Bacteroidetes bacterium]|nr:MAG: NADH dehydrogenase [Bacteroidota bacterium]
MKNNLIITGANGYLGHYIVQEAVRQGYGVIACYFPHFASVRIDHPSVQYVEMDITQQEQKNLSESINGKTVSAIINAAALLGSSDFQANEKVNTFGVQNMMDFARAHGIERFIQISSVVVMKQIKGPYGITKLKGQELLTASGLSYTVFIPALIMGPESLGLNRVLKNVFRFPLFVPLIGRGKETQHPVYVKDFAWAILSAVASENTKRKTYQIAGDRVISFKDFIQLILKHYHKRRIFVPVPVVVAKALGMLFQKIQKVPLFTAEHVKGILQDSNLDTEALRKDLGYVPTPFEKALNDSLKVIGNQWNQMLKPRDEKTIRMK